MLCNVDVSTDYLAWPPAPTPDTGECPSPPAARTQKLPFLGACSSRAAAFFSASSADAGRSAWMTGSQAPQRCPYVVHLGALWDTVSYMVSEYVIRVSENHTNINLQIYPRVHWSIYVPFPIFRCVTRCVFMLLEAEKWALKIPSIPAPRPSPCDHCKSNRDAHFQRCTHYRPEYTPQCGSLYCSILAGTDKLSCIYIRCTCSH